MMNGETDSRFLRNEPSNMGTRNKGRKFFTSRGGGFENLHRGSFSFGDRGVNQDGVNRFWGYKKLEILVFSGEDPNGWILRVERKYRVNRRRKDGFISSFFRWRCFIVVSEGE